MSDDVRFVTANGLRFGYLESGTGPLVVLVHGFPDTAHSWDATRSALAAAGFRAVAPFTRGYAPTDIPPTEAYDSDTLGRDVIALVQALGGGEPAVVVGHDWGAERRVLGGGARARGRASPGHDRDPASGVDHADTVGALGGPPLLRAQPPERAPLGPGQRLRLRRRAHAALVAALEPGPEEAAPVKAIFRNPKNLEAALGYYRALRPWPPSSHKMKIRVPTVSFAGDTDILPATAYESPLAIHRRLRGGADAGRPLHAPRAPGDLQREAAARARARETVLAIARVISTCWWTRASLLRSRGSKPFEQGHARIAVRGFHADPLLERPHGSSRFVADSAVDAAGVRSRAR